ncbi:unnamed protein product [Prunus armeniaca]
MTSFHYKPKKKKIESSSSQKICRLSISSRSSRFQICNAFSRLASPSHALQRLLSAKRATRETADRLGRFPPALRRCALRRARRHAFESIGTYS